MWLLIAKDLETTDFGVMLLITVTQHEERHTYGDLWYDKNPITSHPSCQQIALNTVQVDSVT